MGSFENSSAKASITVHAEVYITNARLYSAGDYVTSNEVVYWYRKQVESLQLSPRNPILFKGHSLYLGKTITPEDAYYKTIDWMTSDQMVATANNMGYITGIEKGCAEITATIGVVSASVPVTVYTISTNIEDIEDQQEVTDTAGSIIDDIGNSDTPDLSNTDVDPEDAGELQEQIHEGIDRGDEFRSDIILSKRDWAHFKKYESQIQQWLDNGEFVGGFDINVEVYHQDGAGNKYHIANITQFENEIGFTISPEALEETAPGQLKDLRMIRIHDGQLEVIPVTVNKDGSISAKSDKFSEFVLLSVSEQQTGIKPVIAGDEHVNCYINMPGNGILAQGGDVWQNSMIVDVWVENVVEMIEQYPGTSPNWEIKQNGTEILPIDSRTQEWAYNRYFRGELLEIPSIERDYVLDVICTWGGQTSVKTITVHCTNIDWPTGLTNIEDMIHTYVGAKLSFQPEITPEGWEVPGYSQLRWGFDDEADEFAIVAPTKKDESTDPFLDTNDRTDLRIKKSGTYESTYLITSDRVSVPMSIVVRKKVLRYCP